MDVQTSIEQVAGIFAREHLHFDTHQDGESYRLWFGRDAVFVHFRGRGGRVHIAITSPALQDLDREDAGYAVLLNRLNELNCNQAFVRWMVIDDTLVAAHDLLGEGLRAEPLVNAIHAVASAARDAADELEPVTGGLRYDELADPPTADVDDS